MNKKSKISKNFPGVVKVLSTGTAPTLYGGHTFRYWVEHPGAIPLQVSDMQK